MLNSTDRMANEKTERDAAARSARRAEEASIVAGLRTVLQADEQLLGFARARIAGGIKGRLNIGPEAFFAPFVNIGLTERRFIIQHLHGETGKPSEILPHFFALADLQSIHFADIETFGGVPASRLVLHLANGQSFRLRLTGENNFASSKSLAEVFRSLTSVRKSASGPTERVCISCRHIMDRPSKFCPYCGASQMEVDATSSTRETEPVRGESVPDVEKVTVVVTETQTDLLDDALAFLRSDPPETPPFDPVIEPDPSAPDASSFDQTTSDTASADTAATGQAPIEPTAFDAASSEPVPSDPRSFETITSEQTPFGQTPPDAFGLSPEASLVETPASTIETIPDVSAIENEPEPVANSADPGGDSAQIDSTPAPDVYPDFTTQAPPPETETPTHTASDPEQQAPDQPPADSPEATSQPESGSVPSDFTYSEAASSETSADTSEEAPQMRADTASAAKSLRVHFHIKHPAVQFDAVITGSDADDVVAKLKDRIVGELKFPVKLYAMRLTPIEFAQEIVSKYNQEEHQTLPRPNSCREFLHLVQAIGYATVDEV